VIIGGLGSFWGTLAGGVILGLAQTTGAQISPEWQTLAGHIVFLIVLVFARAACSRGMPTDGGAFRIPRRQIDARLHGGALGRSARRPRDGDRARLRLAVALAGSVLPPDDDRAGAMLEPAGGIWRARQHRPAGLRRARRLCGVRAGDPPGDWIPCSRSCWPASSGAVLSIPTGFVVFRLQGAYFAIGTWVAAEVYRLIFAQWQALGGGTGTSLPSDVARSIWGLGCGGEMFDVRSSAARDIVAYWMALVLVVVVIGGMYLFLRTRNGLALSAIRDNPDAAESVGVDTDRAKFAVYIFAATGRGAGRRADLLPVGDDHAAERVLGDRMDGLRPVHRGDRRHRHAGGADHRRDHPASPAKLAVGLRDLVPDGAGRAGHRGDAGGAQGDLGLGGQRYDFSIFPTRRRLIGPDTPVPDYTKPIKEMTTARARRRERGMDLP
jgi:hypothetical protein